MMQSKVKAPHVSSKACIVRDGKLLLVQYKDVGENGVHYNFPGGKVRGNENIHDACIRKVKQETGGVAIPGDLMFVYEYIGVSHGCIADDKHSVSLIFQCDLSNEVEPSMQTCTKPDDIQTDVCWVPIEQLDKIVLFPKVGDKLKKILSSQSSNNRIYWGDIL